MFRYLYPADHHQARITKANKDFEKEPDFKVITFPVKIRDIHRIEKKNSFAISVFGYESKLKIQSIYQKNAVKKNVDLWLIGEKGKRHYVLVKDFSTFMYDHILNYGSTHFLSLLSLFILVQKKY